MGRLSTMARTTDGQHLIGESGRTEAVGDEPLERFGCRPKEGRSIDVAVHEELGSVGGDGGDGPVMDRLDDARTYGAGDHACRQPSTVSALSATSPSYRRMISAWIVSKAT